MSQHCKTASFVVRVRNVASNQRKRREKVLFRKKVTQTDLRTVRRGWCVQEREPIDQQSALVAYIIWVSGFLEYRSVYIYRLFK